MADEEKKLGFLGVVLSIMCSVPFMLGLIAGLALTPLIVGFNLGREIAGDIGKDEFGETSDPAEQS